ncbi:hypothetical protein M0805_005181 [Coniferiporia weirii]|nr:hypothetical protein M0805_005181 [Coniferiporia weirii]
MSSANLPATSASPPVTAMVDVSLARSLFDTAMFPKSIYLVVCLIFVVALYHVTSVVLTYLKTLWAHRNSKECVTEKLEEQVGPGRARTGRSVALRRIPLALLNSARIAAYRTTLPIGMNARLPLVEIVVSVAYLLAMLVFEFVNDPTNFLANRAGILAVCQLTFVVALAGKNNIVSALTGIGYEKLNILHRAASRTLLILIWVHTWGWWKLGLYGKHSLGHGWMQAGLLATVALTLAAILGIRQIRNKAYNLFLASHIILVFIFLLGGFYHVKCGPAYLVYTWPPFIVWGLDRALRIARTLHIRYLTSKCKGNSALAILKVISPDTLCATMRVANSRLLRWRPGQSAFLSVPSVSYFPLEAHPLTIASIDEPISAEGSDELELKFIIRTRRGFTRRLHDHAARAGGMCQISTFIDGPYGEPPALHTYPTVVLMTGGSGVSFTLPLLLDIARRTQRDAASTFCNRVLFIWSIRERDHIDWISDDLAILAGSLATGLDIDIRVFITGKDDSMHGAFKGLTVPTLRSGDVRGSEEMETVPVSPVETTKEKLDSAVSESASEDGGCKSRVMANSLLSVFSGRPSIGAIIDEELSLGSDSMGVGVSGPQSLIDDVRVALKKPRAVGPMAVLRGGTSVFLHVEHFGI